MCTFVDGLFINEQLEIVRLKKQKLKKVFIPPQKTESMTLFACPVMRRWENLQTDDFKLNMQGQGIGFLAVYEDLQEYRRDNPDVDPFVFRVNRTRVQ